MTLIFLYKRTWLISNLFFIINKFFELKINKSPVYFFLNRIFKSKCVLLLINQDIYFGKILRLILRILRFLIYLIWIFLFSTFFNRIAIFLVFLQRFCTLLPQTLSWILEIVFIKKTSIQDSGNIISRITCF